MCIEFFWGGAGGMGSDKNNLKLDSAYVCRIL